jgi:anti-sigma factor RsiW
MQPDHDPEFSRLLREKMDQHKAPDRLRRRIIANLEQQRQPSLMSRMRALGQYLNTHWLSLSGAAASGVLATLLGTQFLILAAGDDNLMQQVTSSHTRALVANHLIDVVSSDGHTVKPWFAGKIDYSPRVSDYATEGFVLAGGRLDYVNDRIVAALVYKRRLHMIDAYVWPTKDANTSVSKRSRQGINVIEWTDGGMRYYLVSDVEFNELNELARLMRVDRGE